LHAGGWNLFELLATQRIRASSKKSSLFADHRTQDPRKIHPSWQENRLEIVSSYENLKTAEAAIFRLKT
jgi:hypothetical protein